VGRIFQLRRSVAKGNEVDWPVDYSPIIVDGEIIAAEIKIEELPI
jgi:hypothetical protein